MPGFVRPTGITQSLMPQICQFGAYFLLQELTHLEAPANTTAHIPKAALANRPEVASISTLFLREVPVNKVEVEYLGVAASWGRSL